MIKVTIIGMGYVGFPLACAIAKNPSYEVYGLDINNEKINKIQNRISPVEDKKAELDIKTVNINATTDSSILKDSEIIIIAVPTPVKENKEPDLTPVLNAAKIIIPYLKKNQTIILESTVNPGVCNDNVLPILETSGLKGGIDFDLIHCPERIDPGNEKYNVYNIARNIGGTSPQGTHKAAEFYKSFLNAPINEMSSLMATEATKIIENTFRDINIAYVNELAKSFDMMGLDIVEIINGAANKPFAFMPHYPGCGVGGHCIPVDPYYLIEKAKNIGFTHEFLIKARKINNSMPGYTVGKLVTGLNELEKPVKNTNIGLLGLSYKANIGDLRESPAFIIKKKLEKMGANLMICEPYSNEKSLYDLNYILENCNAVIIATNHNKFIEIKDWKNIKLIIDGRNCLDKEYIKSKGIKYYGIGRK